MNLIRQIANSFRDPIVISWSGIYGFRGFNGGTQEFNNFFIFQLFISFVLVGSYAARFLLEGGITKLLQNHAPGMAKTPHLTEALLMSSAPDK